MSPPPAPTICSPAAVSIPWFPLAVIAPSTSAIGMTQIRRKNVVKRSSFSG